MRRSVVKLGMAWWALCACLVLLPHAAAAGEASLAVDLDGDGRHDSVSLDLHRPSVLRVWLSASGTTQVLVSRQPLHHLAVSDLDGDHKPELIASDSQSRIQVWSHRATGLRRYQPRRSIPKSLAPPRGRRVDGGNREPEEALTGGDFGPSALARTAPPAPADEAMSAGVPPCDAICPASPAIQPFSARPPPAHPRSGPVRRRF